MLTRRYCLALPLIAVAAASAQAQGYPSRPVTLVVPYAAGGTADILARLVAEELAAELGRSVVVESKPGASGTIGANAVVKAEPDGHTLLFTAGGPLTIDPHLSKTVPYKTETNFTPIVLVAQVPSFLVVNPKSGYDSVAALVATGKAQAGGLKFASPGVGTSVHLLAEIFRLEAGFEAAHVPYRGGAPAVNDLVGGHIDFLFENVPHHIRTLKPGDIVVLDNLGSHKGKEVRAMIRKAERNSSSYRPIAPTSIRSNSSSPSSNTPCERPWAEPSRPSTTHSRQSSKPSNPANAGITSQTQGKNQPKREIVLRAA